MEVSAVVATAVAAMSIKSMELKWVSSRGKTQMEKTIKTPSKSKSPFPLQVMVPIFISINPSHIHPSDLRDLFTACNLSPHRGVEAVDLHKLRIALSYSSVLVSVFCKPSDLIGDSSSLSSSIETQQQKRMKKKMKTFSFGELLQNAIILPSTRALGLAIHHRLGARAFTLPRTAHVGASRPAIWPYFVPRPPSTSPRWSCSKETS
ncbi:hypothetical protein DVH24_010458 [Malus domestica]|uniref:Glucosamine-phosphate N-acetyltransferase n=1 Tax=Malus domestica TaxID=3750 RepID=A0A498JVZ2_MALDO|nr:hypothetical protein DVH24_010458 [Malus domestica]